MRPEVTGETENENENEDEEVLDYVLIVGSALALLLVAALITLSLCRMHRLRRFNL